MQGVLGGSTALKTLKINSATAGAADIEVQNIGSSSTVGVIGATTIGNSNTNKITLDGTVYKTTGAQTYTSAAGDKILAGAASAPLTFTTTDTTVAFSGGDVVLAAAGHLTINTGSGAGDITFGGDIHGTASTANTNITGLTSGTGTITLNAIDTDIEDVTVTGPTILKGNITTVDGGAVLITGDVQLDAATIAITTDDTGGDGTITIDGKVDSEDSTNRNLDIVSGSALAKITGNIGTTDALATLDINATGWSRRVGHRQQAE